MLALNLLELNRNGLLESMVSKAASTLFRIIRNEYRQAILENPMIRPGFP